MLTNEQIFRQLGHSRTEELLRYIGFALACSAAGRELSAWILWKNAGSLIQEALDEMEVSK